MSRLFDRCVAQGLIKLEEGEEQPQLIMGTKVSNYLFEEMGKQYLYPDDFPNCAPPFEKFWIEFDAPSKITSEEGDIVWPGISHWGWLFEALPYDPKFAEDLPISEELGISLDKAKWTVEGSVFIESPTGGLHKACTAGFIADTDGSLIFRNKDAYIAVEPNSLWEKNMDLKFAVQSSYFLIQPALLTLSFMHCKNVKLVEAPTPWTRKKRKKAPFRYHVLEIEPMKQRLKYVQNENHTDLKQALHICRGHFKDYRQSGLFGQHKGVYWWDSLVKGSIEEGVVKKDYAVV